ncbi:MAG: hypothetical protein ABSA21_10015 [Candidatus Limnocylindrales bacterium]
MGAVDVQRAFHSLTLPPPRPHGPGERVAVEIDTREPVAVPTEAEAAYPCPDLECLSDDECEAQVRETVIRLRPILRIRPQPLPLVLELLECEFDLRHGCAERLFWLAHERGLLTLHEGRVYLGQRPASVKAGEVRGQFER